MSYDSPEIPADPGVSRGASEKDRLPCPVCKIDDSIESANALHRRLYQKTEREGLKRAAEARRSRSASSWSASRFDGLEYPSSSAQGFESFFQPVIRTFRRGHRREELAKRVDTYYEVCAQCGILWDPYAHARKRELNRTMAAMADFMGSPVEVLATLDDDAHRELG